VRSSRHSGRSRIESTLSAAARRRTLTIALEQAATALALVLAGAIMMLLLGAQIFAWYWLAALAVIGFALIIVRVRSRPIQRYRLAQLLDRRLRLSDSLSTAWFLLTHSRGDDAVARLQIERAERIAASVQPAAAFPFSGSRAWALAGAFAALAFGLVVVRYMVTKSLNLQPALLPFHALPVLQAVEEPSPAHDLKAIARQPLAASQAAQSEAQDGQTDPSKANEPRSDKPAEGAAVQSTTQDSQARPDSTERSSGQRSNTQADSNRQPEVAAHDRPSQQSPEATEQSSVQQSSSGLLDKMKDALSSLMAKIRPNGNSQPAPPRGNSREQQKSSAQAALGPEKQGNQQNSATDRASQQQNTQGNAQGQTTEKAPTSQARNSGQSSEHKSSDSQSGIGRQDGDKDIKQAEQLRAMGKLAEIIGKRSATLTGDMTVETPSGKQELKTEYSQRLSRHSDVGGEINRDQIPLVYQQYVRDYMQQIRQPQQSTLPP
jgi:hypothetical protein